MLIVLIFAYMSWEFGILGIGDFTLNLAPVSRPNLHFHAHATKAIPIQESAYSEALLALFLEIPAKIILIKCIQKFPESHRIC